MENKQNIKDLVQKFYPYAKEKLGFDHPVRVIMRQDSENAKHSLGKTAYYDPAEKLIVLYIANRHPKDVLRSFSHELVHHAQNCRGDLDDLSTDAHYAKDGKGREIEAEAYLLGNGFLVRDWEDGMKHKGVNEMKLTKEQLIGIIENTIEAVVTREVKNPGKYMGGQRQKAGIDDDGDGVPNKADKNSKDGSVQEAPEPTPLEDEAPPEEESSFDSGSGEEESLQKYAQDMIDALDGVLKKDVELEIEDDEEIPELPSGESMDFDEAHCGGNRDDEDMNLKESKKQVITEKPQQTKQVKETNKAWYNTSLYKALKSKWTK